MISEINEAFDAVAHFRKNLFILPSGKTGKEYVEWKAKLFQAFAAGDSLEQIALKAQAIMEHLLLQEINGHKSKQHKNTLERRLQKWNEGRVRELLDEAQEIQNRLKERKKTDPKEVSRIFAKHIFEENVSTAINFLDQQATQGGAADGRENQDYARISTPQTSSN